MVGVQAEHAGKSMGKKMAGKKTASLEEFVGEIWLR